MPEPKAQLVDPQGPIDVPGLSVTGVTTATGGFVGQVQGTATGLASTTANLSVGIVTATKFKGNTTGNVSGLADDTNINVGIITSTSFTGDLVGNAAGLSTTTANIKAGIMSATSFAGNFTGVASGITGTPNIVVGIMTGTLKGDGSSLTGIAATNWITNNVTANSSTTTVDLSDGNVVKFTQSADTTVSFANTGTSNIVTFIRTKDATSTARALTWPSAIKWNGGSAPTLVTDNSEGIGDINVITLLTRDEGVTWYGWESVKSDPEVQHLYSWGYNNQGQVGDNSRTNRSSPVQIPGYTWDGAASGGGRGASVYNKAAIKTDGTLWVWGQGSAQGQGPDKKAYSSPVQVPGTNWAAVNMGNQQALATKTDGTLWTWGNSTRGSHGQNLPDNYDFSSPKQVGGTDWKTGKETFSCGNAMFAIKTDGKLYSWGCNEAGMLGMNEEQSNTWTSQRSSPTQVGTATNWKSVYCSNDDYLSMAVNTSGELWTWGQNSNGALGLNEASPVQRSMPTQVPGTSWDKIRGMGGTGSAIRTDGTLWIWGKNDYGQLGQNQPAPSKVSSPIQIPGTTWSQLGGGYNSTLAIKTDGTLWSWGYNARGALGMNQAPAQAPGLSSPTQIPGTWLYTADGTMGGMAFKAP
mgnify:CR=1 FL=1